MIPSGVESVLMDAAGDVMTVGALVLAIYAGLSAIGFLRAAVGLDNPNAEWKPTRSERAAMNRENARETFAVLREDALQKSSSGPREVRPNAGMSAPLTGRAAYEEDVKKYEYDGTYSDWVADQERMSQKDSWKDQEYRSMTQN
jgi:hypothetical protein